MGHNLLAGKRGIITGALDEHSIAWKVAEKVHEEGGTFTLSNAPVAMRMATIKELGEKTSSQLISADATSAEDVENLYKESMDILGGKIDFVLHSIGMSPNVRKKRTYGDLNYDWYLKSLDISGVSFHRFLQVGEKLDAFNEWASVLGLSYIASQRTFPDYSDMAQAKAVLESIARSYGERLGRLKKVRVNTISQSPTFTTAGKGISGFLSFYNFANSMSPLGNATADDCANYVVTMFSDMTKMVTMQNLFHDGGFSFTGVSEEIMDKMSGEQQ